MHIFTFNYLQVLQTGCTRAVGALPILVLLLFTSCFELHETVHIKGDGSGSFKLEIDLSEHERMLMDLARHAAAENSNVFGEGELPFEEVIQAWTQGASQLNDIRGISGAMPIVDRERMVFGWQFDFESVEDLNLVLALKEGSKYNPKFKPAYAYEKKTLYKKDRFSFNKLLEGINALASESLLPMGVENQKKAIFAEIRYHCTIQVENKVKKWDNSNFVLSEDQRTLTYKATLENIHADHTSMASKIKFK